MPGIQLLTPNNSRARTMVLDYTYINTAREFNSRIETLSGYAARGSGQAGEAGVSWSGGVALYRRARNASRRVEQPFPPGLDLATLFHTVCKLNITTPVGADIKVHFLPRVAGSPCQKLQVNLAQQDSSSGRILLRARL